MLDLRLLILLYSLPKKSELPALLNGVIESGVDTASSAPKIRLRGLINTGNVRFANSVLQILVYGCWLLGQ